MEKKKKIDDKYKKLKDDLDREYDTKLGRLKTDVRSKIDLEKSNYSKKLSDLEDS